MSNPVVSVLLDKQTTIDTDRVAEHLHAVFPDVLSTASASIMTVAGIMIAILNMPTRLPDGWQIPTRRAEAHWREASAVCDRHCAHLTISAIGEQADRLKVAQVITAVVGAVAAIYPSVSAVFWDSSVVNSGAVFAQRSRSAFAAFPNYPVMLWISFHPFKDADAIGVMTMGLTPFVGREIEFETRKAEIVPLVNKVQGFIVYLLQRGKTINDGEMIGISKDEHITVQHFTSRRFGGLPVFYAYIAE